MRAEAETEFDLRDVLTESLRRALPTARRKRLGYIFDCRIPRSCVLGDLNAIRCGLHRLLCGTIDLTDNGFLVFDALGSLQHQRLHFTVWIAGSGLMAGAGVAAAVLERLGLEPDRAADGTRSRKAHGTCPCTGFALQFAELQGEGVLFKLTSSLLLAHDAEPLPAIGAKRPRCWVVDADEPAAQLLARRLQRLGWATRAFRSIQQALRHLETRPHDNARPALVIAAESDAADAERLAELKAGLPAATACVLCALVGSDTLARGDGSIDVVALPLSPGELERLTFELAHTAEPPSGHTVPAPLGMAERRKLLVVDDDELNRLVAVGMAQTLNFEAHAVCDGFQAIRACRQSPPDVVLMDVSMPEIDGIETTRRLRDLQREGTIPPFPILGVTAEATAERRDQGLEAGMDGYLFKPLMRASLETELRRLLAAMHAPRHG